MTAQNEAAAGLVDRREIAAIAKSLKSRVASHRSKMGNFSYYTGADALLDEEAADALATLLAQVEELRRERDGWKKACRSAGICMACALAAPDTFGCTDCLNTGWDGGAPTGFITGSIIAEKDSEIERLSKICGPDAKNFLQGLLRDFARLKVRATAAEALVAKGVRVATLCRESLVSWIGDEDDAQPGGDREALADTAAFIQRAKESRT